jgi:hypothetical protein
MNGRKLVFRHNTIVVFVHHAHESRHFLLRRLPAAMPVKRGDVAAIRSRLTQPRRLTHQ